MLTTILNQRSSNQIIGADVADRDGHVIGTIESLIIDVEYGRLNYAIVKKSGLMGLGTKHFAVPWPVFRTGTLKNTYTLDASPEVLKNAPELDADHLPDWTNLDWNNQMYASYQLHPYWREAEQNPQQAEPQRDQGHRPAWQEAVPSAEAHAGQNENTAPSSEGKGLLP